MVLTVVQFHVKPVVMEAAYKIAIISVADHVEIAVLDVTGVAVHVAHGVVGIVMVVMEVVTMHVKIIAVEQTLVLVIVECVQVVVKSTAEILLVRPQD